MSMTVQAMATARRNVVERIARFLNDLERDRREPSHWEGDQGRHALAALERQNYPAGEDAMMRAERPDIFRSSTFANPRSAAVGSADAGQPAREPCPPASRG